jgi:hypothetical protein
MPSSTLEHWRRGSLQLGSVNYYRAGETAEITDQFEGRSCLIISGPKVQTAVMIQSGYNFGILCGTAQLGQPDFMRKRFGDTLVRIKSIRAFAEHLKVVLGARRYYFNHMQYNDLKLFRLKTLMRSILAKNTFDELAFGEKAFAFLYRESFLPSLFVKPTGFAVERELRLVFELDADLAEHIRPNVPDLVNFFEIVVD